MLLGFLTPRTLVYGFSLSGEKFTKKRFKNKSGRPSIPAAFSNITVSHLLVSCLEALTRGIKNLYWKLHNSLIFAFRWPPFVVVCCIPVVLQLTKGRKQNSITRCFSTMSFRDISFKNGIIKMQINLYNSTKGNKRWTKERERKALFLDEKI